MFAWIPIIGPIIQGIVSIFGKWQDTKLATLKTVRESDIAEAQVSEHIIHDTQDDIGLRFMRDLVCFPVVIWSGLIGWDSIVALNHPNWMIHVADYPNNVSYLPYAVIVFLLGNIGINMWSRK